MMANDKSRLHRPRVNALVVGLQLAPAESDDGLVLHGGVLRSAEWMSHMAGKVFRHHESLRTRYKAAYPEPHDATTPSLMEFSDGKKPRGGR